MENGSEKTSYEWDELDHLAKAEGPFGTSSYAYDGLERLSERKSGGSTQITHYGDLTDLPTYDVDGEGKTTTSFVQGAHGLVEQRSGEATSYPLADGHGDITAITGAAGGVESRQTYNPWGAQLSGPGLEMGYLGAWQRRADPASGLIQMGERSYSPSLGGFLSEDPVLGHFGIGASVDRYLYVWDNPLNRYDLNGRDVCILGACASETVESVTNNAEELGAGWKYVEKGAGVVGSSVGSSAEDAWDWAGPSRQWIADRAQDFWKENGNTLGAIYQSLDPIGVRVFRAERQGQSQAPQWGRLVGQLVQRPAG
jgi:RHS repeat-associated protein